MHLKVILELTLDDRKSAAACREELEELRASITAAGVVLTPFVPQPGGIYNFPALDMLGRFALDHADKAITPLASLLGGWLIARSGRKVRLKIGDVEAEARTLKRLKSFSNTPIKFNRATHLRQSCGS